MKRILFLTHLVAILLTIMLSVLLPRLPLVYGESSEESPRTFAAVATPIAVIPDGHHGVIGSLDNWVILRDVPCGPVERFKIPSGTVVIVRERAYCGGVWYRVELATGAQGWVPADTVTYTGP